MMKTLFIYNPNAGKKLIKNSLYDIINTFSKANYDLTVFATQKRNDCRDYLINNAHKFERIIVSGGDGTLNEAINGLLTVNNKNIPEIGYIPAGSTNDFAASLELSKEMGVAAENIVNGKSYPIDIGKFNNLYFVYIAAFGALTEVSYSTPQDIKNVFGHLAYVLEGAKSLTNIKSHNFKVTAGNEVFEDNFIYGMVTNSLSVGGTLSLKQFDVDFDDGLFEMLLIKEPSNIEDFNEIILFLLGQIKAARCVISRKVKSVKFESAEKVSWTIDGEYANSINKVNIETSKKAITLIK